MKKAIIFILILLLGFILGILWVSFDPKVHIETHNKVIVRIEDLPEVFMKYFEVGFKPVTKCPREKIN